MARKVLFVTTVVRTVEAFLIPHIRFFKRKGYEVGIAANTENRNMSHLKKIGIDIHHVPFSRTPLKRDNWNSYKLMKKIIKQYHILHLHTPIASFLTRMAASKDHTVIYSAHGFHFNENGSWISNMLFKTAERAAGRKTEKLIVTNKDDLSMAKKIIAKEKIHYVPGVGVDTKIFDGNYFSKKTQRRMKSKLGLSKGGKIITLIAEFNDNKRQIDAVDACEILKSKMDHFTFLLIGNGENFEMIQNIIRERKLDTHIKCVGFSKDISKILSITDIGLLLSLREGLPRSVMEMMAMKIPVIATDIRGNRDLIVNGENGYLVPIKDPSQLADKCHDLLNNKELAKQFGEKGRQIIDNQFSIENVLREMELVYEDLGL